MAYLGNNFSQQNYTPATDFFSGNGVTTTFTLTRPVQSVYGIEVVVNNVQQNPSSTYIVNASGQIVFVVAPSAGTNNVYVNYNAPIAQLNGVGQGTVGTQQLGSVSNINSVAGNLTLQTNGTTGLTVDQSQNIILNGNLGIGTLNPTYRIQSASGNNTVANTTGTQFRAIQFSASDTPVSNTDFLEITNTRTATGPSWTTRGWRLQQKVDATWMAWMQFNANGNTGGVSFGAGTNSTTDPTAIPEVMRINASGHMLRPRQPAFMIFGTGGAVTYADAAEFIIGTGVHYDSTNSYNTATGRYTAPVAGFYSFSYGAYTYVGGQMSFKRNGVTWAPSDSIGLCTAVATEIRGTTLYISLAAGDNVSFGWRSGYSGNIYHSHSWFAGHLVG